jgi:hypothetical protein
MTRSRLWFDGEDGLDEDAEFEAAGSVKGVAASLINPDMVDAECLGNVVLASGLPAHRPPMATLRTR